MEAVACSRWSIRCSFSFMGQVGDSSKNDSGVLGPQDPRITRKCNEVKGFRERFELLFAKAAVTLLDRQRERIEGGPVAVVDVEGSGFAVPRNHEKQERTLGEIEPANQLGFRLMGKADDGSVLFEPLQTQILQVQDGVNGNLRHCFPPLLW